MKILEQFVVAAMFTRRPPVLASVLGFPQSTACSLLAEVRDVGAGKVELVPSRQGFIPLVLTSAEFMELHHKGDITVYRRSGASIPELRELVLLLPAAP
jgi:hypothetical protein